METFSENLYFQHRQNNLKGTKSPFDPSKKSNKKALSDIKNVLNQHKSTNIPSLKRSNPNFGIFPVDKPCQVPNSSKQPKKAVLKKLKEAILNKMDDELFVCELCAHDTTENISCNKLSENLRLTCSEIDKFATDWSNHLPLSSEADVFLTPMKCDLDVLDDICFEIDVPLNEESSFIEMVGEDCENTLPQKFSTEMVTLKY